MKRSRNVRVARTTADPRAFSAALEGLGVAANGAVHVGALRRSDIAGAKGAGMGAVRLRQLHDDADAGVGANAGVIDCAAAACAPVCPRPEGDMLADS